MAIAVEILIGVLKDAGVPALLALVVAWAIGWSLFRKLGVPARRNLSRDMRGRACPTEMAAQYATDTPVLDWRERLVWSKSGDRNIDFVVSGTSRR
jgi:hypothetical protein